MRAGWIILAIVLASVFGELGDSHAQQPPSQQTDPRPVQPQLREQINPTPNRLPADQQGPLTDVASFESGNWNVVCRPGGAAVATVRYLDRTESVSTLPDVSRWRLELSFRRAATGFTRTPLAPGECSMPNAAIPISGDTIRFVRVINTYRTARQPIEGLDGVSFVGGVFQTRGLDDAFNRASQSGTVGPGGVTSGVRRPAYGPFRMRVRRCDRACGTLDRANTFYIEQELGGCGFGGVQCH